MKSSYYHRVIEASAECSNQYQYQAELAYHYGFIETVRWIWKNFKSGKSGPLLSIHAFPAHDFRMHLALDSIVYLITNSHLGSVLLAVHAHRDVAFASLALLDPKTFSRLPDISAFVMTPTPIDTCLWGLLVEGANNGSLNDD